MVAETSIKAYRTIKPFLNGKRAQVYECFKLHPNGATRQEIARWYGEIYKFKECGVCGRANELIERGDLIVVGTKKDAVTGHSAEILKVAQRVA